MNDFDAAVEWLVQSGRAKSKGDARRTLIEQAHQEDTKALLDPDMRAWYGSALVNNLAGASPGIPNIANRHISHSGQAAGSAVNGLMETFTGATAKHSLGDRLERSDYGYGLGLGLFLLAGFVTLAAPTIWPLAAVLAVSAFGLCWWFG